MNIYDLLPINPTEVKVHLAAFNGREDPLDLYFDGSFKAWQESQNKRNFQRKYILSLIKLPGDNLWLFAGLYLSHGIEKYENDHHHYRTELTDIGAAVRGRLVVQYQRRGRNSYPYGENLSDDARVYEIKPEPLEFSDFTQFKDVHLTRSQLELMVRHQYPAWKSALSSVSGVYLISDQASGKLYVGSAYGEQGIWARWENYATSYHGGNAGFRQLFRVAGEAGFDRFQYSILETCDIDLPAELVIAMENRWKERLLTREYGYNEN